MVDMNAIERLVNQYVDCWKQHRPEYKGLYEDNNFGCEHLQVFRNQYEIETFHHNELCQLSAFLTRSLRGQINRDHKLFWSWVSYLTFQFDKEVQLFQDRDWVNAFRSHVNLLLAGNKYKVAGPERLTFERKIRELINYHLLMVRTDKFQLAGPYTFAVLEGLLRRKNRTYITVEGIIHRPFQITDSNKRIEPFRRGRRVNRIDDSLRLFEQVVVNDRGRTCIALREVKNEIRRLYPGIRDVYDEFDSWRNTLVHGQEYWQNRVPILTNMICLLLIDEIESQIYNNKIEEIKKTLEWRIKMRDEVGVRPPWEIFPPDL